MKTIVSLLAASTLLFSGAYALAATPTSAHESSAAMMKSEPNHSMDVEKHIRDLHAKLKITPAEQSQWDAVAQAMRDNAAELDSAISKRDEIAEHGTAMDDLKAYGDIVQVHADSVKKLSAVFASLYDVMPAEQKKVADEVFAQHPREGKRVAAK
jgi:periplasmic protein CpxP/Spy